jgi:hypothetical protein
VHRGSGLGFWKSINGGVDWTNYTVPLGPSGFQDWYPAVIDPYTPTHLIMAGHEQNYMIQSFDSGQTWGQRVDEQRDGGAGWNGFSQLR